MEDRQISWAEFQVTNVAIAILGGGCAQGLSSQEDSADEEGEKGQLLSGQTRQAFPQWSDPENTHSDHLVGRMRPGNELLRMSLHAYVLPPRNMISV